MDLLNKRTIILTLAFITSIVLLFEGFELKKRTKKHFSNTPMGCYVEVAGRCTGSVYCRACRNCSRCKYCNSGGSCGVCGKRRSTPKRKKTTFRRKSNTNQRNIYDGRNNVNSLTIENEKISEEPYYMRTLIVQIEGAPLRSGGGWNYYVIQKLKKGEELFLLSMVGEWVKVKVKRTESIGFVHYKQVFLLDR
ncbi:MULTISPECIES: hypothetical protein [unclassified Tenacibaculum]|uniref:hypothetical protein n=1 Tax=unclassified Tenacibaculum TaxID=2635139 RepID=UPI001F1BD24E|nr:MULTISPECIES: hypothetical protein [unclassified Tenacibaculum]MCF2875070.1 hypothetical protein [Tenacibaculum sp. Cn5-1]MCF2935146.1 hypothetical protein [Tenacibaculum sp. Cn5-34]MCG7511412.1 hypothetical protein [Tenacibaculum sp. Cn5-46]